MQITEGPSSRSPACSCSKSRKDTYWKLYKDTQWSYSWFSQIMMGSAAGLVIREFLNHRAIGTDLPTGPFPWNPVYCWEETDCLALGPLWLEFTVSQESAPPRQAVHVETGGSSWRTQRLSLPAGAPPRGRRKC